MHDKSQFPNAQQKDRFSPSHDCSICTLMNSSGRYSVVTFTKFAFAVDAHALVLRWSLKVQTPLDFTVKQMAVNHRTAG